MSRSASKSSAAEDARLANQIESWVNVHGMSDDRYLSGLLNALRTQQDRNTWLSLDPNQYLPTEPHITGDRTRRLVLFINVLRNSLVFLPVALTWLAISKATNAFAIFAKSNALNIINFLDFWQNGYGVLDKKWSIGHIATIDFQIIVLVIVITIFSALVTQRWQKEQDRRYATFDRERTELSLEIALHAQKSTMKNLKNFRARVAEELAIKVDAKTLRKLRSYEA